MAEYYNNNINLFTKPEERSFKQFNFKSQKEAEEFKLNISGKSTDNIILYSEDNNIIYNDFQNVDRNKVLEQLANEIFEMKKGSISNIIKTTLAYHIIILEEIYPSEELTFDEVKNEINDTLTNFELDNFYNGLKTSLDNQILDGYTINEIADQNSLKLITKKKIIKNNNSYDSVENNLISFSFNQTKDFVSDVVDINDDTSFIVNIDNIYPSEVESIENVFDSVVKDFIFSKKNEVANKIYQENIDNFSNIVSFFEANIENISITLNDTNELPFSFKEIIFKTEIDKVAFNSDEDDIYFAKIKNIVMPEQVEESSKISLISELKTAFGSEIVKTKKISFNDELINGLLSQYK
tara:strand:- start:65 stop:1123 length:1059 start_codon:yes stop_codon:yes gene_type:complete